ILAGHHEQPAAPCTGDGFRRLDWLFPRDTRRRHPHHPRTARPIVDRDLPDSTHVNSAATVIRLRPWQNCKGRPDCYWRSTIHRAGHSAQHPGNSFGTTGKSADTRLVQLADTVTGINPPDAAAPDQLRAFVPVYRLVIFNRRRGHRID